MFGLDVKVRNRPVRSEAKATVASSRSKPSWVARKTVSGRSTSGAIQITTTQITQISATQNLSHFGIKRRAARKVFIAPASSLHHLKVIARESTSPNQASSQKHPFPGLGIDKRQLSHTRSHDFCLKMRAMKYRYARVLTGDPFVKITILVHQSAHQRPRYDLSRPTEATLPLAGPKWNIGANLWARRCLVRSKLPPAGLFLY